VIRRIEYAGRTLEVQREGKEETVTYLVGAGCQISLAGQEAKLEELRTGDIVDITHDTPDAKSPTAKPISARRPPDPARWALLVGVQDYEDATVTKLTTPAADVKLLRDVLASRYKVPDEQILSLVDESQVRLDQAIPSFLGRLSPDSSAIVYYAGHAYKDEEGKVWLAPKNFDRKRMPSSGLSLQWLVDHLEQCPAKQKLLLLDTTYPGDGLDLKAEPSSAEMLRTLQAPKGLAPLRTVTAVASCMAGQRGALAADKRHDLFAWALAEGFGGAADKNQDNVLEPTELFGYLTTAMAEAGSRLQTVQTPELFLPDARPPRLTEEAKKLIRKLAAMLRQERIDMEAVKPEFEAAEAAAGREIEPKLLYGLLMMKARQRPEAMQRFDEVGIEHADQLIPAQGVAWLNFERLAVQAGMENLIELVGRIKPLKEPGETYPGFVERIFVWVGQLREFATTAAQEGRRPSEASVRSLDAAVAAHGSEAERLYEQGRARTRAKVLDFDKRIVGAVGDEATAGKYRIERRQLPHYATFPYDDASQSILAGLDR